ncbi:hypothetical protein C789_1565 [Microcystis aeruginosa FACHB-905 = DIANCHI905]|nr:hypothetical protein C789_1565 [Microcystis aeruginosa FACHB-905 = DIANCHI905]
MERGQSAARSPPHRPFQSLIGFKINWNLFTAHSLILTDYCFNP